MQRGMRFYLMRIHMSCVCNLVRRARVRHGSGQRVRSSSCLHVSRCAYPTQVVAVATHSLLNINPLNAMHNAHARHARETKHKHTHTQKKLHRRAQTTLQKNPHDIICDDDSDPKPSAAATAERKHAVAPVLMVDNTLQQQIAATARQSAHKRVKHQAPRLLPRAITRMHYIVYL